MIEAARREVPQDAGDTFLFLPSELVKNSKAGVDGLMWLNVTLKHKIEDQEQYIKN